MKTSLFCFSLLTLCTIVEPSARDLSLSEAVSLAREHSLELKRAVAERQVADEALRSARAARFPTLSANAVGFYNTEIASLEIETPAGTISRELGSRENYQADLQLGIPLFTGGKISGSISASEASTRYREALLAAEDDRLVYQVRVEYLNLYRCLQLVDAASHALRRAQVSRQSIQSLYDAGAADSVAILESELAINDALSRLAQTRNEYRSTEIRLSQLLGLNITDSLSLTTPIPDPTPPIRLDQSLNRPELSALTAAIDINRAGITQARSAYWPSLSAFGGYSAGMPNLDRFNNTWNDYWQIGARLSWSLNLGLQTKADINRARYTTTIAEHQRDILKEDLQEQSLIAFENLQLAFEQYQTAASRVSITSRNHQLAQSQHREGALSSNRLLEIESTLGEAEAALAAAVARYHTAQSAYFYSLGSNKLAEGF